MLGNEHGPAPVAAKQGEKIEPLEGCERALAGDAKGQLELAGRRSPGGRGSPTEEVGRPNGIPRARDDGRLDRVLQLAHVAGPIVRHEDVDRLVAHPVDAGPLQAQSLPIDEVAHQERDVLAPLAQRGEMDMDHLQAVEEILPEAPRPHGGGQIGVGSGDEAEVAADQVIPPEPAELVLLEHAQELRLGFEGEVRDFVQEQCGAVRQLEDAHSAAIGSGERTALVTEQLAL